MTDRDVYLHTLPTFHCNGWGMPYAVTAMGVRQVIIRKIDGEEILRRVEAEGVTLFNCAPAVIAAVLDAAAARRAQGRGGAGARPRARRHRGRAAAVARPSSGSRPSSAGSSSRSTGSPRRRRCSPSTARPRSGTGSTPASARSGSRRAGVPAVGVRMRVDDGGRGARALQPRLRGLLEAARGDGQGHRRRLVPHRRRRLHRRRLRRDHRPQEGRDHHRRRERLVDRGGGLPVPAPRGGRGRGDRRARREVGRDHQGPRGAAPGRRRRPSGT